MASRNYFNVKKHRELKKKSTEREKLSNQSDECMIENDRHQGGPSSSVEKDTSVNSANNPEGIYEQVDSLCNEFRLSASISTASVSQTSDALSNEEADDDFRFAGNPVVVPLVGIREKLRDWALRNSRTLHLNVISQLLTLLREEGHAPLPKTAQTLLGTCHRRDLQIMSSANGKDAEYTYLGIEHGLRKIILSDVYAEDKISAFVLS